MLELKKGTQLADRYTLVRRLGGDSETQTWLARDRLTRASVALKIAAGDQQSSARLRAEWQANIRLMHAHIVRAFEFHSEPEAAFFSQQFIDGPDFGVLAGLPVADVLGPVGMLLDALAHVHAKGVVHRDIKASNVLIDGNGAPYLSDFGVSCAVGEIGTGGSPIAQSPQSIDGQPASAADDIFALGSLIYELLAGRPPWLSADLAAEIRNETPAPLRAADGSSLPPEVVSLVARMLDKDAGNRPAASEVATQLRKAGFAPLVATISGGSAPGLIDEVIESVESVRPASRSQSDAAEIASRGSTGLNRTTVGIGLAALIVILSSVIFVLPNNVSDEHAPAIEAPLVVDEEEAADTPVVKNNTGSRTRVYVDPEVRKRVKGSEEAPTRKLEGDDDITFSENRADFSGLDEAGRARFETESTLGELLSALEVLEGRGVDRWAVREHRAARELYAEGDRAYLEKDYAYAEELYLGALTVLEPLYERIEPSFQKAYEAAVLAFEAGDRLEALQQYELAVAITPSHPEALAGYQRAKNLEAVLRLVDRGLEYEKDLELVAAQTSFEQAVALDNLWQPAHDGILRVAQIRTKMEFDTRMTEGFDAIAAGDFLGARAAFRVAGQLMPESSEPADGMLQVDQGLRLQDIMTLEREAQSLERDEHWDAVVKTYEEILKVDSSLSFANDGLAQGRQMSALHTRLDKLIAAPDQLSVPSVMQSATMLVVSITTRADIGPRLAGQRDELSRLLKRAATPLSISLVSDNVTEVFVYKVGRLGKFMRKEISLRPGTYVVVGTRAGYRDVRLEFRVAPEIDMEPVIIQCEEPI
jgi:serine/threonine protein kinase/tetratricopeptide (TPR) repeat protein